MNRRSAQVDEVFFAVSDATRRDLLTRIAQRPLSNVSDLAAGFQLSLNAVSKHLKVLERAGLVIREKHGRQYQFRIRADGLDEAQQWMEDSRAFWTQRLDALESLLVNPQPTSQRDNNDRSEKS